MTALDTRPVATAPAAEPPYDEIARSYGTPTFLIDLDRIVARYREFTAAFARLGQPTRICYSVKTNYAPTILRLMHALGAGADVVSGYEMRAALATGFAPENVVLNGLQKDQDEIDMAVALGVLVNIDSPAEIDRLSRAARAAGRTVDVGIRVHPSHPVYTSPDPSYAHEARKLMRRSKFGWPIANGDADRLVGLVEAAGNLRLVAVHCHLGSQITSTSDFLAGVAQVVEFTAAVAAKHPIRLLDLGGGYGTPGVHRARKGPLYRLVEAHGGHCDIPPGEPFDLVTYVDGARSLLAGAGLSHLTIGAEPGRILVSDAIRLLCRVSAVKRHSSAQLLIVEAGQHLLPTGNPDEHRGFHLLGRSGPPVPMLIGGPLCYEGDVLGVDVPIPDDVAPDDLMLIDDAGAYSLSRSTNFIRSRAAAVVVRGDRHELCWRRETDEDIFRFAVPTLIEEEIRDEL